MKLDSKKFLLIFVLLFTTNLFAKVDFETAFVNRTSIDLYEQPLQESNSIENRFLRNEEINIYSCTSDGWCKTDGGYVKKHLLTFKNNKPTIKKAKKSLSSFSRWKKDQIFQRTSVDEDIKDILTSIALQNGSQIIFGKGIEGTETLSIESMPLEGAFNLILERNNLNHKWQGNTIIVNSITETTIKREFIILKELNVDKLKRLLKRYNLYSNLKHKVTFDREMNSIFVEAEKELIDDLTNLISRFEIAEKVLKESRIAQAKHNIAYEKLKEEEGISKAFVDKKKKYGLNPYDKWEMKIDIIPLKYIHAGNSRVDFQGKTVRVDPLEETLKGLLGSGYSKKIIDKKDSKNIIDEAEKAYIKIDKRTNSIIIKDYPDRIAEIKSIIKRIDKPAKLVEIEVTVASGNTGFSRQVGLNLAGYFSNATTRAGGGTSNNSINALNTQSNEALTVPDLASTGLSSSILYTGSRAILNVQLSAIEEEGGGKVLSNPKVITLNNKEATIVSGKDLYLPITTDDKIALENVNTGVSIRTTPHIIEKTHKDDDEYILMDIKIERSELGVVTTQKIEKATNEIESTVILKNGQTLILGGLFQYDSNDSTSGVPLLKDIPLLGYLFSTNSKLLNKTELLFFITPKVITSKIIEEQNKSKLMDYQKTLEEAKNNL